MAKKPTLWDKFKRRASPKKRRKGKRPDTFELEASPGRKIHLTDVCLRDGHQSLLATRMRTEDLVPTAEQLDAVGFWSLEVWGGATFDACLRFLKEDPWERLRAFRQAAPNTRLQMLLRGQNLVGYRHYADDVLERFIVKSAEHGIDVFRIFDALNDIRNLQSAMRVVRQCNKHVQATICYTVSPVHSLHHFVEQAKRLEDLGTDSICIKDMAGLLPPFEAYALTKRLKEAVRVPIHLHTHYTSGMASMSSLMAILGGLDVLDTALSPLAGGTSHPPTETFIAALKKTPYDTGLDLSQFPPMTEQLRAARKKYHQFESDYTGVDTDVLLSQVPGGMISNLASQLAEQNAIEKMKEIPRVRKDMGYPPLVTPTSQIVGTQATLNVMTGERYKVITNEAKNYFLGLYGEPPGSVDSTTKEKAVADDMPISNRPADNLAPELTEAAKELSEHDVSEEDVLSYTLFPSVALQFLHERASGELRPEPLEPLLEGGRSGGQQGLHLAPMEFNVMLHGESYHVRISGSGRTVDGKKPYYIKVDDKLEEIYLEPLQEVLASGPDAPVSPGTGSDAAKGERPKPGGPGDVTTPMPGRVVKVLVTEGSAVAAEEPVIVIEAMKMENRVTAPIEGTVKAIYVSEGDLVNCDETLIRLE